jgi:hemolysin-activating ACP:hemolysin acyltransferase
MGDGAVRSFYRVYRRPVPDDLHVQLGYAVSVLCASRRAAGRQLRFVDTVLVPAIMHKQLVLLFDEDSEPAAYVLWASLTAEVERRIARGGRLGLHFSEWDEGERIMIVDMAARPGFLKYVLQYCRDELFRDEAVISYMRLWRPQQRMRQIDRDKLLGCLRSMPAFDPSCRCGRQQCALNCQAST